MRRLTRAVALAVTVVVLYGAVTAGQIVVAARRDSREPADAIIVLGAAQYDGEPSLALRARLDHAVDLYQAEVAPVIWVTGGRQPGDRFSEASTSSRYLIAEGIPNDAVQLEIHGGNSYQSLAATARYLRRQERRDVLLVSDAWHAYRIAAIAREVGLEPRVSPSSPARLSTTAVRRVWHETMAVGLGRFVGYRRLTGLGARWGPPG
jgi:uncharacterized SAM-binding protein YcdF (DUF218 family)